MQVKRYIIELEATVNAFRETLRRSWTRRAIRTLTMSQPVSLSSSTVTSLRDREWEERERYYHDAAIAELNSLVRKYNTVAPCAVRRAYYARDTELARAYHDCGEEILRGVDERGQTRPATTADDAPRPGLWTRLVHWLGGVVTNAVQTECQTRLLFGKAECLGLVLGI